MNRLLPLFLLLFPTSIQAQELLHCGADEMRIQTLQANPKIAAAVIERDAALEEFTREYAEAVNAATLREPQGTLRGNPREGGSIYIIPVVFHVIHDYGNENIDREQILDGLRVLNETFRKTREDTADIHADFQSIHADCEIEFHLATKDPEGNCHSGINRIASGLTNSGDHRVKDLIHWDPSMYLNVYIVSNAAGLAGHAVWPADADTIPEWDGIVIAHNYVGAMGTSNPTQSVVFAHECGHYLNLHHIWGGNNVPEFYYLPVGQQANCNEDDLVADTPNSIGWSNCNLNASSCGNVRDNVQNAMDYSYCNIMFTEGQKTRMHACLNSSIANRNNLWTNSNLIATGVLPQPAPLCAADFEADNRLICNPNGEAVTFTNTSYHGEIDSMYWEFPGGDSPISVMENPIVVYYQPGSFDVSLTVYANGSSQQVVKEDHIVFLPDSSWSYPFWSSFEGTTSFNGDRWFSHSLDTDNEWEVTELAAYSGTRSAMVDNWDSPLMTSDHLYGPPLDLSSVSQMRVEFKYAFTGTDTPGSGNRLHFQVSNNCETTWSTRLNLSGGNLETVPPQSAPFAPTSESEWHHEVVNIPSTYLEDGFRFRWVYTSAGNNRLFLDDINIDVNAGLDDLEHELSNVVLYPNPTSEQITVQFNLETATDVTVSVVDLLGQTVVGGESTSYTAGAVTEALEVTGISTGMYLLRLETERGSVVERFVVE